MTEKSSDQNKVVHHKIQYSIDLDEKHIEHACEESCSNYILPTACTRTIIPNLPLSLISTQLYDEKTLEDLIERMKNEEQHMKNELQFMKHGEVRMKYKITLMKHCENRMEHEIQLMKRREKPVEEIILVRTAIYDNEKYMNDELEQMKIHEKLMTYEIERMIHYQTRFENEIRSIKNDIEPMKHYKTGFKNKIRSIKNEIQRHLMHDYHGALAHDKTELNSRAEKFEELRNELKKRETKLVEHANEINKRQIKLEEHSAKRTECDNELEIVRTMIEQDEELVEREKQLRKDAIKRRQSCEIDLIEHRANRKQRETELLECIAKHLHNENQLIQCDQKDDEEHQVAMNITEDNTSSLSTRYSFHTRRSSRFENYHTSEYYLLSQDSDTLFCFSGPSSPESLGLPPVINANYEISVVAEQPKYEIFISYANHNDSTIGYIRNALPQWYSSHAKNDISSTNIKICLDNTSTAVISIINRAYESSATCEADMTHIFKRQFPLVLVVSENDFKPNSSWLTMIWHAFNTQKVVLNFPDFEENLLNAVKNAEWNLSPNLNVSNLTHSTTDNRSNRFLGILHEWTVAYSDPAQVSHNYRQFITDPLRITTDTKLRDIYYKYIRLYSENCDIMKLFEEGANKNDIQYFIQAYTKSGLFSATLNRHLAANVLFYFESTLYDTVDYQLIKCLIDFVALFIYRQELQPYLFSGTVHRGLVMSEEDLFKYIVGSRIMNTSFLSTSKDKVVAEVFSGKGQQELAVICTYVVYNKNNRRTALDIGSISCFPHEREVLILPFSAFYVKSITRSPDNCKPIEMTLVEDDSDTSENINTT